MRTPDLIRFARDAATGNPLRTSLLVLAMAIGVAAVSADPGSTLPAVLLALVPLRIDCGPAGICPAHF